MESSEHSAQFVDKYRSDLIQRVIMVMPIADNLLAEGMIHKELYSNISAASTNQDKMRVLFTALHSGGNKVKSAFLSMLKEHEPNLVQDLEFHIKQGDQRENNSTIRLKYKEFIRGEYATVQEYNSLPGEHVKLDDRYTEPLIIQKHRQQREREEEIRSRGQNFHQVMDQRDSETYKSTKVEKLFDPDEHGDIQRTVILQGHSGTGKSFTTQKIMSDWAFGRLYEDRFDFVFHLRCRELNQATGNKSVMDLLNYNQSSSSMIKQVLDQSPERVLFLVDGFDELELSLDVPKDSLPRDPWTQYSPEVTLSGLIRKQILHKSFLLVTTRSTALEKLKVVKHPVRYAEILGFSEEGVKVYFEKFFKRKQHSHQAYDSVRKNETLFTACFIPVICWIICTVYREQFDEGTEMIQSLETTTSIFVEFVATLLKHHCQDLGQSDLTILQGLGKLAEKGMEKQQVLFDHVSVSQTVSDPSKVPFLCKFIQKMRVSQTTMYSFMHLSFQEFFTALSYVLLGDEEAQEKVRELLSKVRRGKENSHLLPIVQFLFGILNKDVVKRLEEKHISCSQGIWTQLKHFILEVIEKGKEDQIVRRTMQLFTFHCLYELHADDFVKEAMDTYTDIDMSGSPLKKTDCWVLMYCLQHCKSIKCLELSGCNLTAENMKILLPALQKCKALVLQVDDLADDDLDDLLTALGEGKSLELDLSENNFSDEKVQDLLVALTKHKPRNVEIGVKSITSNTADKFMFLISNAHGVLERIELHSCGNVFLSGQLQKDGVRAPQIVLWIKVPEMKMICDSIRTSRYRLTGVQLSVSRSPAFPYPTDKYREILQIGRPLRCGIWPKRLQSALVCVELSLSPDEVFDRTRIDQLCQTLHYRPEWDEHADELISLLRSQTSLEGIYLLVSSLTERCAASVVSLSQACSIPKDIILQVNGFLLEEGIQCLRESKRRPDCQLLLLGRRCTKLADQCSEEKDMRLSCNDNVLLALHGESFIEIVLRHGNESGIDDTWNGNENDSDGTWSGNESDSDSTGSWKENYSDCTGNGNENDSDGTGNGNENDSDGTGNGNENDSDGTGNENDSDGTGNENDSYGTGNGNENGSDGTGNGNENDSDGMGNGNKNNSDGTGNGNENNSDGTGNGNENDSDGTGTGNENNSDGTGNVNENNSDGTGTGNENDIDGTGTGNENNSDGTGTGNENNSDGTGTGNENNSDGTGTGNENNSDGTGNGNENDSDGTGNGNENDSDGTGKGNENDSDGTGNGNENDSDGTGNGNENDSDGTGNGNENDSDGTGNGNENGSDGTGKGNENDSDGTGNGNENDSDGTGNGNENDSDGTGNGNENDSDGTGNGKESNRPRDDIKCKGCCVVG
ncbi:NACHT, LRR and PYD domains-containing protein 12-like isoform 1-T5 [Salvelinus alpinus]